MQLAPILRALVALVLCTPALPAAAQINPGFDPATPIRIVYRVETMPPLNAFFVGFNARGINEDLLALTSGASCNNPIPIHGAAWVSTTADREQAARFAQRYLERTPQVGSVRPTVYIYTIRADANYISVPGAFYSAMGAGRENRAGYSPEHANALEYLLYTRPILGEQAVVAPQVQAGNIANATPLWLQNGAMVEGFAISNDRYVHDAVTSATNVVPDWRLPSLLPPYAILSSEAGATGTCAMSCDRATSASSFSIEVEIDYATQCSASDAMTPLLFDIIND
ncbi:hypothetical protein [Noviluteimonas gilva]|uniref:Pertussis toxin subunit 1 n=1 Tax=Noviluteimonas gilva TaxID=2682097 RepID=A0A7C9HM45_9GAMM|nr:hypothetical protein [Lysobacter gilvus]MUV14056.1 hypothetical protein [Lysobacter gilvus]